MDSYSEYLERELELREQELDIYKSFIENELKQGTWERTAKQHGNATDGFWTEQFWKCSECNYERRDVFIPKHKPPYCEECGAYMKGDKDDK